MKITILALGSRGDTQPYVALGLRLQQHGHRVRLCAGDEFKDFAADYGLDFSPLGMAFEPFVRDHMQKALHSGRNVIGAIRSVRRAAEAYRPVIERGVTGACEGADTIIGNLIGSAYGFPTAQARGVPYFMAAQQPYVSRTSAFAAPGLPSLRVWGYNRLTYRLIESAWSMLGIPIKPVIRQQTPILYSFSSAVIARPMDWGTHIAITGYWFLDHAPDWEPPADLIRFLDDGEAPVYIGFGSMNTADANVLFDTAVAALKQVGLRGIVAGGKITAPDESIYVTRAVPHDWLFPRMAAVVHHGGAGTTGAGLRAGVPSIVVPFFGDQPFWGERVKALGVGPEPIPRRKLTVERLGAALRAVTEQPSIRECAAVLGAKIRSEDGVGRAVEIIERG